MPPEHARSGQLCGCSLAFKTHTNMDIHNQFIARYKSFDYSMNHTLLSLFVALEVFREFPSHLPDKVQLPLINGLRDFVLMVKTAKDEFVDKKTVSSNSGHRSKISMTPQSRSSMALLKTFIALNHDTSSGLASINFDKPLYSQHLFLALSYADAFVTDCMSYIIDARPEVLKKADQLTWKQVIELGSWADLMAHIKSLAVTSYGDLPLEKRVRELRDKYGVPCIGTEQDLDNLHEAALIRNNLIHCNGIISNKYISQTKRKNYSLGDTVTLTEHEVISFIESTHNVCYGVFSGILAHFFKIEAEKISGIAIRDGKPKS